MTSVSERNMDDLLMDPLRGETFCLSSYLANVNSSNPRRDSGGANTEESYTISLSKTLVGPPPESMVPSGQHSIGTIVLVTGLSPFVTDSEVKRYCTENFGRPKFIYMHVNDLKTGLFSGTCVVEFSDVLAAKKGIESGILSSRVRGVSPAEFDSLISSDWPMLEHGPPQGVFAASFVSTPTPAWNTNRPAPSNPWQK